MANGLDRLERLFKRKSAPARNTTASNINCGAPPSQALPGPDSPFFETTFPPPSFIRPTASRMHARDEFDLSSPNSAAPTSSSNSRRQSRRLSQFDAREMSDTKRQSGMSTTSSFHLPSQTPSLLTRRHDRKPGGLVQLHLPGGTASTDTCRSYSPPSSSPSAAVPLIPEDPKVTQRRLLDALPIYPATKVVTPPPSDQDEFNFPSPPSSTHGPPPTLPTILSPFTPEPSPGMVPQRDSLLSEPKTSSEVKRDSMSAPLSKRTTQATISSTALLDDDWRDSYVQNPQATVNPEAGAVFQEPPLQDFLALTVEDLAEIKTSVPSNPPRKLPPPPPVLPPSAMSLQLSTSRRNSNMLSPLAPDEVAAFQAARIAKKYDFDFLYVVNFWPKEMNHLHRPSEPSNHPLASGSALSSPASSFSRAPSILYSPTSDCPTTKNSTPRHSLQAPSEASSDYLIPDCCPGSTAPAPRTAVAGRLLAAYGLNMLSSPFRPGTRAHRKILREGTDGWIEYRKTNAQDNEFARGYARSYYTASVDSAEDPRRASAPETGRHAAKMSSAGNPAALALAHATGSERRLLGTTADRKAGIKSSAPRVDRGIVFAAYRRPRSHGGTVHSSQAELDALEKDAGALVELVLNFQRDKRRWEVFQQARRASD